jgi:hypothetical protein
MGEGEGYFLKTGSCARRTGAHARETAPPACDNS